VAQNFGNSPAPAAPMSCTIPAGNGNVKIFAGPSGGPFPVPAPCPSVGGNCLRWDYQWSYINAGNPSLALVSTASNVTVLAAPGGTPIPPVSPLSPTTFDSSINWGNVASELGIKFTPNGATYNASVFTDTAATVGTVTAGFKSGNRTGFCAIAGATKPSIGGNPELSGPIAVVTNTGACKVAWTQSADGCVTGVEILPGSGPTCAAIPNANGSGKTNLQKLYDASTTASCATEINAPGSTNVCRYNSLLRTYTCVTY